MPHKKKKAGILTLATSLIGTGVSAISNGMYIEAAVFFAMSGILFLAYEELNIQEVDFAVEDAQRVANSVGDVIDQHQENK